MRAAALLLAGAACLAAPVSADQSVAGYSLVQNESDVRARVSFFGIGSQTARFPSMRGSLSVDRGDTRDIDLRVTLDARHLRAGDGVTRRRLKSESFFWVERHPLVEFRGTDLVMESAREGRVTGTISARGVTRPLTLDVEFDRPLARITGNEALRIEAETRIDRYDFGMDDYGTIVGRTVRIRIDARMVPD